LKEAMQWLGSVTDPAAKKYICQQAFADPCLELLWNEIAKIRGYLHFYNNTNAIVWSPGRDLTDDPLTGDL
jgi:hypothetical protein